MIREWLVRLNTATKYGGIFQRVAALSIIVPIMTILLSTSTFALPSGTEVIAIDYTQIEPSEFVRNIEPLLLNNQSQESRNKRLKPAKTLSEEQIRIAKLRIEFHLNSKLPPFRIQKYCVPATNYLGVFQRPVSMPSDIFVTGKLYRSDSELGNVEWSCVLSEHGEPIDLQVEIFKSKGKGSWVIDVPDLAERETDGEFDKWMVRSIVFTAREAFRYSFEPGQLYGFDKNSRDAWGVVHSAHIDKVASVSHDKNGRMNGFVARLENGKTLTANLNKKMEMRRIRLDGKPNKTWTKMGNQAIRNIARANK
ncbi:hypothetical protein KF913_10625 [Candidatus Obscuribacterales bacterium]|jgi:hypothetical protein|nr:hypothetical protein [Candidatus Obscuribacterales bacterium]